VEFEGSLYCLLPPLKEVYSDGEDVQIITLVCQCRFCVLTLYAS
jgi:hypothetical protein